MYLIKLTEFNSVRDGEGLEYVGCIQCVNITDGPDQSSVTSNVGDSFFSLSVPLVIKR